MKSLAQPPPPISFYTQSIPQELPPTYLPTTATDQALDYNAAAFVPQFQSQLDPMASFYVPTSSRSTSLVAATQPTTTVTKAYAEVSSGVVPPGLVSVEAQSKVISKWIKGVKRDFIPLTIRSTLYEPPKPDTPPSNQWPFGYDPIWSEDILTPPIVSKGMNYRWDLIHGVFFCSPTFHCRPFLRPSSRLSWLQLIWKCPRSPCLISMPLIRRWSTQWVEQRLSLEEWRHQQLLEEGGSEGFKPIFILILV